VQRNGTLPVCPLFPWHYRFSSWSEYKKFRYNKVWNIGF